MITNGHEKNTKKNTKKRGTRAGPKLERSSFDKLRTSESKDVGPGGNAGSPLRCLR